MVDGLSEPMVRDDSDPSSHKASDTGETSLESDSSTASTLRKNPKSSQMTLPELGLKVNSQRIILKRGLPSTISPQEHPCKKIRAGDASVPLHTELTDDSGSAPTLRTGKQTFLANLSNYIPLGSFTCPSAESSLERGDIHDFTEYDSLPPCATHIGNPKRVERLAKKHWIRIFVRRAEDATTYVRVYLLPDDVGRTYVDRAQEKSLRACLMELVSRLDRTPESWDAHNEPKKAWQTEHYDLGSKNNDSLFYLFNTLPSPTTESLSTSCTDSGKAIYKVLDADGPPGLKTRLYPYQKRTAATMIKREAEPLRTLDPRLQTLRGPTGVDFYIDSESGTLLRDKRLFEEACGGILGESMGLGKTLICLATILATRGHWPAVPPEFSIDLRPVRPVVASLMQTAAAAVAQARIPWKSTFQEMSVAGEDNASCQKLLEENVPSYTIPTPVSGRRTRRPSTASALKGKIVQLCTATLVIVPQNLLSQWQSEVEAHLKEGELNVLCLDASNTVPLPSKERFHQYDIIIMSRQRLEHEIVPLDVLGAMTKRECLCSLDEEVCDCSTKEEHNSPLKDLHFLRLIMDEGHEFSSYNSRNRTYWALQKILVDRKWIVSGTPASGLIGVEVGAATFETANLPGSRPKVTNADVLTARKSESAFAQERKDLEKLGGIVVGFLNLRPWANSKEEDPASWSKYIMPSAEGKRKPRSLQTLLQSLVVRHRVEDIEADLQLPPLHNRVVHLEPSWHDKLSLNLFLLALVANAVTSERTDQDYMFHRDNRRTLNTLITNLRQAHFYWTSFTPEDVVKTMSVSKTYLEEHASPASICPEGDRCLLEQAIAFGDVTLKCKSWQAFAQVHEMGIFMEKFPKLAQDAWTLTESRETEPLLVGATQMIKAQEWIDSHLYMSNISHSLAGIGASTMRKLWAQSERSADDVQCDSISVPGEQALSPRKHKHTGLSGTPKISQKQTVSRAKAAIHPPKPYSSLQAQEASHQSDEPPFTRPVLKSALKSSTVPTVTVPILPPDSCLVNTRMIGTASAKLSYLLERLSHLHTTEKILVFYEGDHIAYYMAQGLDLLSIRYLIYTPTLSQDRQSAYIHTFNSTETFRVLLMNVPQAAHGLHIASASRVFFINPVWQPNVEAQAIKRAHRIGQTKPVYIETLVLKGTLEDQMLQRRQGMTAEEHQRAERSLLDDEMMSTIIKNASFLPLEEEETRNFHYQVARLKTPQQLFGRPDRPTGDVADPDADLIFPAGAVSKQSKRHRKGGSAAQLVPNLPTSPPPPTSQRLGFTETHLPNGPEEMSTLDATTRAVTDGGPSTAVADSGRDPPRRRVAFAMDQSGNEGPSSIFGGAGTVSELP